VNPIFAAALEIQEFCRTHRWRFCFIGAIAVQRWGEPRLTQDADLTLFTGFGDEEGYVAELLASFPGRRPDARDFAIRYRVLLVEARNGVPLDVSLGAMPFEQRAVERSSPFSIGGGQSLQTCSAEDLIVFKAFAGREKDWLDIEGVALRQAGGLQEDLIWQELRPLIELKESPETAPRLRTLLERARESA
jgi:hypothetical protein